MRQRLISAAVLVPLVVLIFLAGQPFISSGVVVLTVLAAYETSRLLTLANLPSPLWLSVVGACLAVIAMPFVVNSGLFAAYVALYVVVVVVIAGTIAIGTDQGSSDRREWLGASIGVLYPALLAFIVGLLYVAPRGSPGAPLVGNLDFGRLWLLILVLTIWTLDSAAYLVGRAYPRGQMAPRISPNKTWSGAIGGTLAAVVVCALLVGLVGEHPLRGAALGLLIAVTAQAGDLGESLLKRRAGVKDSGALIPGHGGILDRVDSFQFAAPAMFLALTGIQLLTVARPA
jgi:phosphatidate cytidylyltransferase